MPDFFWKGWGSINNTTYSHSHTLWSYFYHLTQMHTLNYFNGIRSSAYFFVNWRLLVCAIQMNMIQQI